jgi:hypothetical protein
MRSIVALVFVGLAAAQMSDLFCTIAGGDGGAILCDSPIHECCGAGTMTPSCLTLNSTEKHCCVWHAAAQQCDIGQDCCGGLGPGASSYVECCEPGTTCCLAGSGSGVSSCCRPNQICCGTFSTGLCCEAGEVCDVNGGRCISVTATVPATTSPTSEPVSSNESTTPAPTDANQGEPTEPPATVEGGKPLPGLSSAPPSSTALVFIACGTVGILTAL